MASLYEKRATERGYTTQTSLVGMAAFTQGERLIGPDGELTDTYHLTSDQTGFSPWHRIYECAGGDWIAVAAHKTGQRAAMRAVFGSEEDGFVDAARKRHAAEIGRASCRERVCQYV